MREEQGEKNPSHGYAIPAAYEVDDVTALACPQCDAQSGEVCEDDGKGVKKIPHTPRLVSAYRKNNPEGRRRYEDRQAHLEHHHRTFKPSWSAQ